MNTKEQIKKFQRIGLSLLAVTFILIVIGLTVLPTEGPLTLWTGIYLALVAGSAISAVACLDKIDAIKKKIKAEKCLHFMINLAPVDNPKNRTVLSAISWEEIAMILKKTKNVPAKAKVCELRTHDSGIILVVELAK